MKILFENRSIFRAPNAFNAKNRRSTRFCLWSFMETRDGGWSVGFSIESVAQVLYYIDMIIIFYVKLVFGYNNNFFYNIGCSKYDFILAFWQYHQRTDICMHWLWRMLIWANYPCRKLLRNLKVEHHESKALLMSKKGATAQWSEIAVVVKTMWNLSSWGNSCWVTLRRWSSSEKNSADHYYF